MFAFDRKPRPTAAPVLRRDVSRSDNPPSRSPKEHESPNPVWQKLAWSRPHSGAGSASAAPRVQRKAAISAPNDPQEREADEVAKDVMRHTDGAAAQSAPSAAGPAPLDAAGAVRATERGGEPLPSATRSFFEPRFGKDFGAVRVHADSAAAEAANGVRAHAFTVGDHVVFGAGQYAPETRAGQKLLAHELTHVVQQRSGSAAGSATVQRTGYPGVENETVTGTLWRKGPDNKDLPPSMDDVAQGGLGDCYLFAAMGAVVQTSPETIKKMIVPNADGTFTVTFKGLGITSAVTQTVTATFPKGKHGRVKDGVLWPLIIEKAYAQEKGGYEDIVKGYSDKAVKAMTDVDYTRFDPRDKTTEYILTKVKEALEKKWPVTGGTHDEKDASKEKKQAITGFSGLYFNHAYVFTNVDVERKRVQLWNPWGKDHPNTDGWVDVEAVIRKFFYHVRINSG